MIYFSIIYTDIFSWGNNMIEAFFLLDNWYCLSFLTKLKLIEKEGNTYVINEKYINPEVADDFEKYNFFVRSIIPNLRKLEQDGEKFIPSTFVTLPLIPI